MSFKKFGGLQYSATNNKTRSQYNSTDNSQITNTLGEINTKIVSESHLDMSGNSIMKIGSLYFMDDTEQITAYPGTANGDLTVRGNLTVDGNSDLKEELNVGGTAMFDENVYFNAPVFEKDGTGAGIDFV